MTAVLLGSMKEGIGPRVHMKGYTKICVNGMEDDEVKITFMDGDAQQAEVFVNDNADEEIPPWADNVIVEHIEASGAAVTVTLE